MSKACKRGNLVISLLQCTVRKSSPTLSKQSFMKSDVSVRWLSQNVSNKSNKTKIAFTFFNFGSRIIVKINPSICKNSDCRLSGLEWTDDVMLPNGDSVQVQFYSYRVNNSVILLGMQFTSSICKTLLQD